MRQVQALLAPFVLAASAHAVPITYVEPKSTTDCASAVGHPAGNFDFDNDARYDGSTSGGSTEASDGDIVFETIAAALASTDPGGIIYLLPGIYHEKVTIAESTTIRGTDRDTVIFDATCLGTNGKAFEVTSSGDTVNFENLTIIGYTHGIYATDSAINVTNCIIDSTTTVGIHCSGADLNVNRCRLRDNEVGIWAPSSAYRA